MINFSQFILEDRTDTEVVAGKGRELYFAFGHNTNTKEFRKCAPEVHFIGKALIKGYKYNLKQYSDIDKNSKSEVQGILWSVPKGEEPTINRHEEYYKKINVIVDFRGQKYKAFAYKIKGEHYNDKMPSKEYIKIVREGYEEHDIPLDQLNQAVKERTKEVKKKINPSSH